MSACGGTEPPLVYEGAPTTDLDPPHYVPPPTAAGETGEPVALAAVNNADQARVMVRRVIRAIIEEDEPTLSALLAPTVGRAVPRLTPIQFPRQTFLDLALRNPRRATLRTQTVTVEQLIDVERINVTPLGEVNIPSGLPAGYAPSDLYVTVNIRPRGRMIFSVLIPGWRAFGAMVIRSSGQPRVLAL